MFDAAQELFSLMLLLFMPIVESVIILAKMLKIDSKIKVKHKHHGARAVSVVSLNNPSWSVLSLLIPTLEEKWTKGCVKQDYSWLKEKRAKM